MEHEYSRFPSFLFLIWLLNVFSCLCPFEEAMQILIISSY